jgi:putative phosphoesterase
MKILLLSDTHGHMDERILSYASEADEVWHAGDIGDLSVCNQLSAVSKLRAVYGNIDNAEIRKEFPLNNRFTVEQTDIWMTHIGGYPGKYSPAVRKEIHLNPPKIFVCGHSHILKVMFDKELNLLHLNPGACGKQGFHQIRTMLRFELSDGIPQKMEVIELERR